MKPDSGKDMLSAALAASPSFFFLLTALDWTSSWGFAWPTAVAGLLMRSHVNQAPPPAKGHCSKSTLIMQQYDFYLFFFFVRAWFTFQSSMVEPCLEYFYCHETVNELVHNSNISKQNDVWKQSRPKCSQSWWPQLITYPVKRIFVLINVIFNNKLQEFLV